MNIDAELIKKMQNVVDSARAKVDKYGYTCISIAPELETPTFTYSVGFQRNYGEPDIILVGFDPNLAHSLIEEFANKLKSGHRFGHKNQKVSEIIRNFDVQIKPVPRFLAFKSGKIAAGVLSDPDKHKMNQMVLPDKNGLFSSDIGVDITFSAGQDIHLLDTIEEY